MVICKKASAHLSSLLKYTLPLIQRYSLLVGSRVCSDVKVFDGGEGERVLNVKGRSVVLGEGGGAERDADSERCIKVVMKYNIIN